ncbi:M15 family metallopeptidase [Clostridium isatidis]|uniref:D-alanyl-D-alanine carboxypeptidase n=1 Tax=Clostridium isatidis TaxID=182773 RepID=A0A343JAS9_9CLOT|nr:M15 family metallopeptidase [Clostridium isatidis]ASW42637.1 D-alanyl-D-alanine carboxypeptidase [Clostridium isatidis]
MRKNQNKKGKKTIKERVSLLITLIVFINILIFLPFNIKNMPLLAGYVLTKEDIKSNEEFITEFNYIRDNIKYLYLASSDSDLYDEVEKIENLLNEGITSSVKILISDLTNKFNEISSRNQLELEKQFNEINDEKLEGFFEEELITISNYKGEFETLYNDKKYNEAKNILDILKQYIDENKKLANIRKIDEVYEENSLEDPSIREPKYINGILIVNKEYGLPDTYAPGEDPEAREAFERMKIDAAAEGIYLNAFSTYRSYYTQERLYNNYVYTYGQPSTDTFSARAGFSEHQTGLAFDIGGVDRSLWAQENFKYTEEAKWLKENCYKYGFILRYPEGKEWKTGYMHESWHFRYIGVEHSVNFANSDLTLEEYLGL